MKAFALRDKKTGLYLPWGRHNRHNSWEEFTSEDRPRLFNTKRAAVNTKTAWSFGKWRWLGYGEDAALEPTGFKCEHRPTTEIEIVEFNLVEVSK